MGLKKILLAFLCLWGCLWAEESKVVTLSYYDYPAEESMSLRDLSSTYHMTKERLKAWDDAVMTFAKKKNLSKGELYRLYAYLYTAQRDAATLVYESRGDFKGSLDPLSLAIIQLFYPSFEPPFPLEKDLFSEELKAIVLPNLKTRLLRENSNITKQEHRLEMFYWTGQSTEYGEWILGWTPWVLSPIGSDKSLPSLIRSQKEEMPSSLASDFFSLQLPRTSHQDNWMELTNRFLFAQEIPFLRLVLIRSIVAIALYDEIITETKLIFIYGLETPNLQGYPTLEAALQQTVSTLLRYFFPELAKENPAL